MDLKVELPVYSCPKLARPFPIDGDLTKDHWRTARFIHLIPTTTGRDDPTPAYQSTKVAACWTDTHFYTAFHCEDRDIWSSYTNRDDPLYDEEVVELFLCPTGDLTRYYEIEVSPRNVIFDAKVFSPDLNRTTMAVDASWDCPNLQTAVQVNGNLNSRPSTINHQPSTINQSWSVELAIPFAAFPEAARPKPGNAWRANFYRIDRADPPEFTAWSPTREVPPNFHVPEMFGWLRFEAGG